jgi:hypothetical protein
VTAPPQAPQLRPLGVGEVIDAGFRLARERFGTLARCTLAVAIPIAILSTLIALTTSDATFDFSASPTDTSDSATLAQGLSGLLQSLLWVLSVGACFRAVSGAYRGEDVTAGESLRYFTGRIPALVVGFILVGLALIPAFVALIIPGIWLCVALAITFPAMMSERIGPLAGMVRSFRLVRGHWWRAFGVLVVVTLIVEVLSLAVLGGLGALLTAVAPDSDALAAVVLTLVAIAITVLLFPVWAGITTVLYYDLRVRKEGVDLPVAAHDVGRDVTPRAPAASFGGFLPPNGSPGNRPAE